MLLTLAPRSMYLPVLHVAGISAAFAVAYIRYAALN